MALINCSECGKELSDKAASCPNCGNPMNAPKQVDADKEILGCPKCGSQQLHSEKTGFSGGKALAGAVLTGGIGLLAGTIGSKEVMITCLKCGSVFKAGEAATILRGSPEQDLEKKVVELLTNGDQKTAFFLYMGRTHSNREGTMLYLQKMKGKHNIQIEIDEYLGLGYNATGQAIGIVFFVIAMIFLVIVLIYTSN